MFGEGRHAIPIDMGGVERIDFVCAGALFNAISRAESQRKSIQIVGASPVAERIRIEAGDFFVDQLPEGDLYALGRILHDWSEEKILKLLGKVHERLPAGGALLIAEKLLDDDKSGPRWAQLQDLNMLTCTEGRERTLGEYESLLLRVGFTEVTGCRTASPLDAALAMKKAD